MRKLIYSSIFVGLWFYFLYQWGQSRATVMQNEIEREILADRAEHMLINNRNY